MTNKWAKSPVQLPFLLLTGAAIVWLVCLQLFQDGMFMDGTQYAAVARNLARGYGSFWNPVLAKNSVAGLNSFHEHPPLVFFLQSLFFKVFGLHNIYPERIYCLVMLLLTAVFMILIWRKVFEEKPETRKLYWLPVFLWVIMPIVFWQYTNNIHENTMGMFTTGAICCFLYAAQSSIYRSPLFYPGILFTGCAFLSKGVPGLFPLAFFPIYFLVYRKPSFKDITIATTLSVLLLMGLGWIILQNPEAKEAMRIWFFDRMLHRISNDPVESSHLHILPGLFLEQLPALIAVALGALFTYIKTKGKPILSKPFLLFLLTGLSASLPLMLTLVQRNFYFTPALPFFALAWAVLLVHSIQYLVSYLQGKAVLKRNLSIVLGLVLLTGIASTIFMAGKAKRDKDMLHDVYALQPVLKENTTVCVPSDIMWFNWSMRCYMMRYNSVEFAEGDSCTYYLNYKGSALPEVYTAKELGLKSFELGLKN